LGKCESLEKVVNKSIKDLFDNAELGKYESWGTSHVNMRCLFDSQRAFESTKGKRGVGQTTILKFLGGILEMV